MYTLKKKHIFLHEEEKTKGNIASMVYVLILQNATLAGTCSREAAWLSARPKRIRLTTSTAVCAPCVTTLAQAARDRRTPNAPRAMETPVWTHRTTAKLSAYRSHSSGRPSRPNGSIGWPYFSGLIWRSSPLPLCICACRGCWRNATQRPCRRTITTSSPRPARTTNRRISTCCTEMVVYPTATSPNKWFSKTNETCYRERWRCQPSRF